jgi:hypothetical protein
MSLFEEERELRGLTLWRPWPDAIIRGGKRIENRSWKPPMAIIGGILAIHAGGRYDKEGAEWMKERGLYRPRPDKECPKGVIVGTAIVTGFVTQSTDPWFMGPFGWTLEDVQEFDRPVVAKGAMGLWRLDAETIHVVRARMETARARRVRR